MKSRTLAVGLILPALTTASSEAKEDDDKPPALGVFAGFTSSGATTIGYSYGAGSLNAFAVGVSVRLPMKGPWYFTPGLVYTQFGNRFGTATVKYEHLALPMLFRADFAKASPVTPFLSVGPQVSFRLTGKAVFSYGFYTYVYSLSGYYSGLPIDGGVVGGAGFEFPIANIEANFQVRLYHGVVPQVAFGGISFNRQAGVYGGIYF